MTNPVKIKLHQFNADIQLDLCGNLYTLNQGGIDASANATIYVSTSEMKRVFLFQSDAQEILTSTEKLRFLVNARLWGDNIAVMANNPANASVTYGAIATSDAKGNYPPDKMLVCHDFTRHIAKELFGTHHAVDLFQNTVELLDNIRSKCQNDIWTFVDPMNDLIVGSVQRAIQAVDMYNPTTPHTVSLYQYTDSNNNTYYHTIHDDNPGNICRIMVEALMTNDASRFNVFSEVGGISNTIDYQPVPFANNDTFEFAIGLIPAAGQEQLTGLSAPIKPRLYKIVIHLLDDMDNIPIAIDER
jgi:hypothetical protein